MAKKNSKPVRIDTDFEHDMRIVANIRVQKGLAKPYPKETSPKEMTKLLRRTQGYRISMEELKNKPKRKNGK